MNERSKCLATEAGVYNLNLVETEYWILEKFAELIVKECANVAYKYTNKTETHELYDEVGWDCLPGDLKIQVEEHFGVEQ